MAPTGVPFEVLEDDDCVERAGVELEPVELDEEDELVAEEVVAERVKELVKVTQSNDKVEYDLLFAK